MRKVFLLAFCMLLMSVNVMAQEDMRRRNGEMGIPPGGFGGPGSRQKDIKYAGATLLNAATTETGKTYESSKADESALLISTSDECHTGQQQRLGTHRRHLHFIIQWRYLMCQNQRTPFVCQW